MISPCKICGKADYIITYNMHYIQCDCKKLAEITSARGYDHSLVKKWNKEAK